MRRRWTRGKAGFGNPTASRRATLGGSLTKPAPRWRRLAIGQHELAPPGTPVAGFSFGRCRPVYRLPPSPSESPGSLVGFRFCRLDYFKFSVKNVGLRCGFVPHDELLYRGNTFAERSGYCPRPRIGAAGFDRPLFTSRTVKLVQPISQIGVMVMAAEKTDKLLPSDFCPAVPPPAPPNAAGLFFAVPGALLLAATWREPRRSSSRSQTDGIELRRE